MRDSGKALAAIKPLLWADTFGPDVEPNKVGRKTIFYRLALGLLTLTLVLNISCLGGGETAQVPAASKAPVISTPTAAAVLAQTATAVVSPPAVVTRTSAPRPTDHGESLSDNGLWFHPTVLYNSVIRVPLLVNYSGIAPAGAVVDAVVQSLDIMPTILAAAGISSLAQAEGNSLWPLMLGRETGEGRVAFAEGLEDSSIAVVTRDWKLIRNNAKGTLELYDMKSDLGELNNLASANPGQALAMESQVKAWMTRHGIGP